MSLDVFWGSGSGPAWRVLLALKAKKVDYVSHLLSFAKKEHKTDAILAMNPRGKVPVLRDGDHAVYESLAILTYLDRKYPETPLFGTSAESAALIIQTISEHQAYGEPGISDFFRPILFGRIGTEEDRVKVTELAPRAKEELGRLEAQLATNHYLAGHALSAADLYVFPTLMTLARALGKPDAKPFAPGFHPLAESYPNLAAWVDRIKAIPGYEDTYPPHWREG